MNPSLDSTLLENGKEGVGHSKTMRKEIVILRYLRKIFTIKNERLYLTDGT